ncbi:MAG: NYN domain-containing protein [Kiritimatiellia bacterium]
MFEIDQKPVPAPVQEALQNALDLIPGKLLLDYARTNIELMKGLSPRPDSVPVLRKRIKTQLAGKRPPDPVLMDLVREASLFGRFIVVLSDKALAHGFAAFCAYLGEPAFLAGLLLDPRDPVRAMAWEHLQKHPQADGCRDLSPEQARAVLESDFGPFLEQIATLKIPVSPAGAKRADPAELAELREKLRRLEEQLKREDRALEKDKTVLSREREQHRVKAEELENRIREQKARTAEAEARARAAEQALADTQGDLHRRLREGVAAELASEARRWLLPLREMESIARSPKPSANLLGDVREVLKQQAERDRAMGTRHDLHKRLEALRDARENVREALKNALNRHPRLGELADTLDREIESLGALLGESAASSSAENALLTRVNRAPSIAELETIQAFLDGDAKKFNLFAPGFTQELRRRITDKRHQLLQGLIPASAAPVAPSAPADRLRFKLALPALHLLVLVDGHNLLLSRPDLFKSFQENGEPGAKAREELARRLAAGLATARDCDIRLYFDGPERSETDLTPRLKVIFSGGGANSQRADNAIVQDLEFYATRYEACYVVTDDAELLARCTRPGVQGRSLNQLADLLADPLI